MFGSKENRKNKRKFTLVMFMRSKPEASSPLWLRRFMPNAPKEDLFSSLKKVVVFFSGWKIMMNTLDPKSKASAEVVTTLNTNKNKKAKERKKKRFCE